MVLSVLKNHRICIVANNIPPVVWFLTKPTNEVSMSDWWFFRGKFLKFIVFPEAMVSVVLVEPETAGNVGSVARAMKNFGLRNLVLVNPQCNHFDLDAVSRAKHAAEILRKAVVLKSFSHLKIFDFVALRIPRIMWFVRNLWFLSVIRSVSF